MVRLLLLGGFTLLAAIHAAAEESVSHIRDLATSGHRPEALQLMKARLAADPDDSDIRVLFGTVLSWEGEYDEARRQLLMVLALNPGHNDALPALINAELWSGHPETAEKQALAGLASLDPRLIEFVCGDLTDAASLRQAISGCDTLYHVAADYRLWARYQSECLEARVRD